MSHNKDIRFLHEVTGEPYAVCRRKMKAAHWNLYTALGYPALPELFKALEPAIDAVIEAFRVTVDAVTQMLNNIDYEELSRAAEEAKKITEQDPDSNQNNHDEKLEVIDNDE